MIYHDPRHRTKISVLNIGFAYQGFYLLPSCVLGSTWSLPLCGGLITGWHEPFIFCSVIWRTKYLSAFYLRSWYSGLNIAHDFTASVCCLFRD